MWAAFITQLFFICCYSYEYGDESHGDRLLTVKTSSGTLKGSINASYPLVRQFLGVPYAEPPVHDLRWEPPARKQKVSGTIDATRFGPNCPQYPGTLGAAGFYDLAIPQLAAPNDPSDEDCLFLSIWAPAKPKPAQKQASGLPVLFWIHGGGLIFGGATSGYFNPTQWIQRSQTHIVVQVNYRLNIFGFPNARGLHTKNLAFLDQRLGLEWVRDNIAAFGGDPNQITLWGHSGGGISVDVLNFAFPDDLIARALIIDSNGALTLAGSTVSTGYSNFTYVASHFNCGDLTAHEELACMRKVPASKIEAFFKYYEDTEHQAFQFSPQVDEKIIFSNYTDRYARGLFSKAPAIIGTTKDEGEALVDYVPTGPNQTTVTLVTLAVFLCPVRTATKLRYDIGRETFRYYYTGNFTNISPAPWMGAYHGAELPLIFGTHPDFRGDSTPFEYATSHAMQDLWLAFIRDPIHGLPQHGWPRYVPDNKTVTVFARDGRTKQVASLKAIDSACNNF